MNIEYVPNRMASVIRNTFEFLLLYYNLYKY